MSIRHSGWTRLLLTVGVVLLLVAAWYGGRFSAGGAGPFGMMERHRAGMMHDGTMQGNAPAGNEGDFDGETGLRRCRAMMGTMTGMHRSMQSMMGANSDDSGRMGRGMMGRNRDSMHERMRAMHEQMRSGMETMNPEAMRRLCRTMHETMQTALLEDASATAEEADGETFEGSSLTDETTQWLQGARVAEGVEDRTGEAEVTVEVGAGDGLQYAPAAVRVDPGTTIRWHWTGQGGLHNVAFLNADVSTSLREEEGTEFPHTFDAPGEYRYECTPHSGVGMRGAVIVTSQ